MHGDAVFLLGQAGELGAGADYGDFVAALLADVAELLEEGGGQVWRAQGIATDDGCAVEDLVDDGSVFGVVEVDIVAWVLESHVGGMAVLNQQTLEWF